MLTQEILIANIQTALRLFAPDLPGGLLCLQSLQCHLLLLATEAAKDPSRIKLLLDLGLICPQSCEAKPCCSLLGAKIHLGRLLAELFLRLTCRFLLLLSREA